MRRYPQKIDIMKTRMIFFILIIQVLALRPVLHAQPVPNTLFERKSDSTNTNDSILIPMLRTAAEEPEDLMPSVIPNSPNAASLGVYGSTPVGHYTGIPDISIPLHEIELDGKKIPVSVSYHASGVKVSQEASWVGLGWSLNAGGCITREMKGGDDFANSTKYPKGYYFNQVYPQRTSPDQLTIDRNTVSEGVAQYIINGSVDLEPDLFHLNFTSFSGTVFFEKPASGTLNMKPKAVLTNTDKYLDVLYDIQKKSWIITDGDGFRYYFGGSDASRDITVMYSEARTSSRDVFIDIADDPIAYLNGDQKEYITAWYLDSIVSPLRNKIEFTYRTEGLITPYSSQENVSIRRSDIIYTSGLMQSPSGEVERVFGQTFFQYSYSYSRILQALPDKILYRSGEVVFQPVADRKDLRTDDPADTRKAQRLSHVEVKNKTGIIKTILFGYDYTGSQNDYKTCRMRLKNIRETANGETSAPYSFDYNSGILPPKYSKNVDHWGFYNNGSNNGGWGNTTGAEFPAAANYGISIPSLIAYAPSSPNILNYFSLEKTLNSIPVYIHGANRNPNSETMQYGILTSVRYPTGGRTSFLYEPHSFENAFESGFEKTKVAQLDQVRNNTTNGGIRYFELTEDASVYFNRTSEAQWNSGNKDMNNQARLVIESQIDGEPLLSYTLCYDCHAFPMLENGATKLAGKDSYLELKKGKYQMYVVFNPQQDNINPHWFSAELGIIRKKNVNFGSGLRVKEIRDISSEDEAPVVRKFVYKGGRLMFIPKYFFEYEFARNINGTTFRAGYLLGAAGMVNNHSYAYYSSPGLSSIGYSEVEETIGNNNGKSQYTFYNILPTEIPGRIPAGKNGQPLQTCFYDKNGTLKKKIKYTYTYASGKSVTGSVFPVLSYHMAGWSSIFDLIPLPMFYDVVSGWFKLDKETVTDYAGGEVVTTKNYYYDATNRLPERIVSTDSRGIASEQRTKFPQNYGTTLYGEMSNKHMVNTPIESVSLYNNYVVSAQRTDYKDTLGMYVPGMISSLKMTTSVLPGNHESYYRPAVCFDVYDICGNILQIRGKDGTPIVYLWGYNYQYPIAEIKNATYEEVCKKIGGGNRSNGETILNRIAAKPEPVVNGSTDDLGAINDLRVSMPGAIVTTLTYKPSVGISTITDPLFRKITYRYDKLNRLQFVEDYDGKIMEGYKYRFQNQ